jgi:tetraacyldisaccharide 4'-kinase
MRDPEFWWAERSFYAALLKPAGWVYGAAAASRLKQQGERVGVPVICVGNLTLGGAGKTPTALAIAALLADLGIQPFFLSRGYGGALAGPVRVDPSTHRAADVGDEPLLLARQAPTIVSHDRVAGARLAVAEGAQAIIMDDGLQNPSLAKDFSIAVVDARRGIGNAHVFPAGPLRAPLSAQLERLDAVLVVGERLHRAAAIADEARARRIPLFQAQLRLDPAALKAIGRKKVLAFAGIGDPEKFFSALAAAGIEAAIEESFPDHHPYSDGDAERLMARADERGLTIVTTEKDFVRLGGDGSLRKLAARAKALPARLVFQDETAIRKALKRVQEKAPR